MLADHTCCSRHDHKRPEADTGFAQSVALVGMHELSAPGDIGVGCECGEPAAEQYNNVLGNLHEFAEGKPGFGGCLIWFRQAENGKPEQQSRRADEKERRSPAPRCGDDAAQGEAERAADEHRHVEGPLNASPDALRKGCGQDGGGGRGVGRFANAH